MRLAVAALRAASALVLLLAIAALTQGTKMAGIAVVGFTSAALTFGAAEAILLLERIAVASEWLARGAGKRDREE